VAGWADSVWEFYPEETRKGGMGNGIDTPKDQGPEGSAKERA